MQFSQVFELNALFISQYIKHLFHQTTKESFVKYISEFTDYCNLEKNPEKIKVTFQGKE